MHDGMPYDPIQGQGHNFTSAWKPLKSSRPSIPHGTKYCVKLCITAEPF